MKVKNVRVRRDLRDVAPLPFQDQKSETQRGYLSCLRSHSINGCGISNHTITWLCVCVAGRGEGRGVLLKLTSTSGSGAPSRPPTLLSYINSASLSEDSGLENLP